MAERMVIWLDDGTTVPLSRADARELYERLWSLVPMRGALTAAGKIRDAFDYTALSNPTVGFDALESAAFTAARGEDEAAGA